MRERRARGGLVQRWIAAFVVASLVATACTDSSEPDETAPDPTPRDLFADIEPFRYVYDEAGQLLAVSDPSTDTAVYSYDPGGNLLGIERSASSDLRIITVTPSTAAAGEQVTIHGTGFADELDSHVVTFAGAPADVIEVAEGALLVEVPARASTGDVTVSVGDSESASPRSFTVVERLTPTIDSVTPSVVNPGDEVRIVGRGFTGDPLLDLVVLDGSTYASVTSASPTELVATIPFLAPSGPVTVVTPDATSAPSDDLVVLPTGFSPSEVATIRRVDGTGELAADLDGSAAPVVLLVAAGDGEHLRIRRTEARTGRGDATLRWASGVPEVNASCRCRTASSLGARRWKRRQRFDHPEPRRCSSRQFPQRPGRSHST